MPLLRRRANISESDMRRHTSFIDNSLPLPRPPPSRASSAHDMPALTSQPGDVPAPGVLALPAADQPAQRTSIAYSHLTIPADDPSERPVSPPIEEETPKHRRFSMLRFRNASDSQLAAKAKLHAAAEKPPPLPPPPEIITTAPTFDPNVPHKKPSRMRLASRLRKSGELSRIPQEDVPTAMVPAKKDRRKTILYPEVGTGSHEGAGVGLQRPGSSSNVPNVPPPYGDEANGTALALPVARLSESSRSDESSGDRIYGSTTTTTHTVQTTTTFFRLPRRKQKLPEPLFPISHLPQKEKPSIERHSNASGVSLSGPTPESVKRSPSKIQPQPQSQSQYQRSGAQQTPTPSRPSSGHGMITPPAQSPAMALFNKSNPSPATALFRPGSTSSGQSSPTRTQLHLRGRSSTLSSLGKHSPRASVDEYLAPPNASSSSIGRKSFGDLLGLSRLRQNAEPVGARQGALTPVTPASSTSKNNSLQIARDSVVLPERRDDDTPSKYLERLLEVVSRSVIAAAVSKGTDTFSQSVLRSYMRGFMFFEDPMDMAIRKLLMEAELPKETQQIDRTLQAFANRYHECNPGIFLSPDQAYFIAFSLLILHTDVFNKNNKRKMQKADYLKNTRGEGIDDEILEVFYDNITYTPFIHVEDDLDINGERIVTHKAKKKSIFPNGAPDPAKRVAKEPIDPYTLIIDNRLDLLRPNLRDVMYLEDPYSYLGTAKSLNMKELQKTFFKTGVLQIVSARSRPDAFMSEKTATNPEEAHPGIVDIKITKVGLLWRKEAKKKKTRSPWQEWGAILTGAQLYFFRNTAWVKNLMHQYEEHVRRGHDGDPCIFKPPLEHFKPDALMSTDGAVALLDSSYKKHKHAFLYVRHDGLEEVLLADDETEMNDWLAKLNYAAAFRTSGVRMRGVVGGGYDGQGRRAIRMLDSDNTQSIQTPTGEVVVSRSKVDHKMAQDILAARRDIMLQKVADADEKLRQSEKSLEVQLRNARHLQVLAPVQPKTREQMLLSAARMAAQLKWTRIEIWRLKCHRDILLMDLEEERVQMGLPLPTEDVVSPAVSPMAPGKHATATTATVTNKEDVGSSKSSEPAPSLKSSRSPPVHLSLTRTSTVTARSEGDESSVVDVFQTPPTSASMPSPNAGPGASAAKPAHSPWEMPGLTFDRSSMFRKASVSSAVSSDRSPVPVTPPRNAAASPSSVASPEKQPPVDHHHHHADDEEEVDANERDLLEQAGLIDAETNAHRGENKGKAVAADSEDAPSERRERGSGAARRSSSDRGGDRNKKVRRSLQRTLREGAGHMSHHRSRRGRDSVSSSIGGGGALDEPGRGSGNINNIHNEPADAVLSRGSGSFVVHGKKASVITFGNELQNLTPDERIRQRKTQQAGAGVTAPSSLRDEVLSSPYPHSHPSPQLGSSSGGGGAGALAEAGASGSAAPDFRAILTNTASSQSRRESGASASTATARSFRDLHRKYSAAQAHAVNGKTAAAAMISNGSLAVPSDEDSDAAVSFTSEGRHTPLLPPIEGEVDESVEDEDEEEDEEEDDDDDDEDDDEGEGEDEDDQADRKSNANQDTPESGRSGRQSRFYTPEPPSSPVSEAAPPPSAPTNGSSSGERLPSPPLQSVSA